ncbi:MAG: hypothetical protein PHU75_03265 [Candidatus Nanopelagicales bacterium]|nr:hypothetical protein [Candidatus Nanopelagicales bacterium]
MDWTWRTETALGAAAESVLADDAAFPTQGDAESWIGEHWQELLAEGVEQVWLLNGASEIYGPMSLRPAGE